MGGPGATQRRGQIPSPAVDNCALWVGRVTSPLRMSNVPIHQTGVIIVPTLSWGCCEKQEENAHEVLAHCLGQKCTGERGGGGEERGGPLCPEGLGQLPRDEDPALEGPSHRAKAKESKDGQSSG